MCVCVCVCVWLEFYKMFSNHVLLYNYLFPYLQSSEPVTAELPDYRPMGRGDRPCTRHTKESKHQTVVIEPGW